MEDITALFLTQLLPSSTHPIRSQLNQLVYQAPGWTRVSTRQGVQGERQEHAAAAATTRGGGVWPDAVPVVANSGSSRTAPTWPSGQVAGASASAIGLDTS